MFCTCCRCFMAVINDGGAARFTLWWLGRTDVRTEPAQMGIADRAKLFKLSTKRIGEHTERRE